MQYLSTANLPTVYLSFYLPLYLPTAYLSTADLSIYVHWLPQTCLLSTYLSIPLYLPTAFLSTSTCQPMSTDYRRPVYRLPIFLFLCICQLPTYLPPTCQPMSTYCCQPFYHLPVFLFLCICQLPTCLLPTCQPMSTGYLSTADLSTVDLYSYLLYAKSQPVNRRPVFLFLSICHLSTDDLSTYVHCLLPIFPPMSTKYLSTTDLSTADLSTSVYLYAVWSRTLIYWASIQENCLGITSTNTTSNLW